MTDFLLKAMNNDLAYVKSNLDQLKLTDDRGKTVLHYAVMGSATDVVRFLLSNESLVNQPDHYGETPLFDCARKGKLELAKMLIHHFAQVNVQNRQGELPIHLASRKGNIDLIKLLIENGSFTNKKADDERLPIHEAILGGQKDVIQFLLKEGKQSWLQIDSSGNSLLHYAARTSSLQVIKLLLDEGLNPNHLNAVFETPLFNAVRYGTLDTVKLLISYDAYLDIYNRRYECIIDLAKIHDKEDVGVYLDEYRMTPAYENLVKKQALAIAVLNRDHGLLRTLVEKGEALTKDRLNLTALDYAKEYQITLCINILRNLI